MMAKVSIIIPVYNVDEKLLRHCIESCIAQIEKEIEIILVDDCSPGICGKICDEYAAKDQRIKVIHKEKNEGLAAARNTGVYVATGEWITFLDGDDWLEGDTCNLVDENVSDDVELIFFGMTRDYENTSSVMEFAYPDKKIFDAEGCKQLQIDVLNYYKRISTAYCKFIKRSFVVEKNIYHDEEVKCGIEGIEFCLRLMGNVKKAMSVKKYLYHYVYNLNSITGAPSDTINQYTLIGIRKMREYIGKIGNPEGLLLQYKKRIQRMIVDVGVGCYFNPNYKLNYKERKELCRRFMADKEVAAVLNEEKFLDGLFIKHIVYLCVKHKRYAILMILGRIRVLLLAAR